MEQTLTHKRLNTAFALSVLGISLTTFLVTVGPTSAFWDCGEYIASCHSLGIPHPPGNPLYVMLGRVFSIVFFFFEQVAYRVNLISPICGALTAMLMYLTIIRATTAWMGIPDTTWKRISLYLGGFVGGLFSVFGITFWFSAVEAEVLMPAMLIIALGCWLALVWHQSKDPKRDRYLIMIAYLVFLGIGVHMFAMMAMAPVGLFVFLSDREKLEDWRIWATGLLMASVIYSVSSFMWLGPIVAAVTFVMSRMQGPNQRKWQFCSYLAIFGLLGYSVHLYIPIRSMLDPIIDENDPETWAAFRDFLERKQYGSENMMTRMFHRRGALGTQFGFDSNMGFLGFYLTQFFHFGQSAVVDQAKSPIANWGQVGGIIRLLVYLIPTAVMLFGWGYLYKRNRTIAILLITLFLMGTIVLVLYMNFADGTRPELRDYQMWLKYGKQGPMPVVHREVRVRDYFFTPGFMFLGLWIGVAFSCLLHYLFTSKERVLRTTAAPIAAVLFALSPIVPMWQNFAASTRSGDWVPYDYAYNLLMSCDKDGILFTNGDNDTFPLWFLQEAEGIRKDVRIVNLSLLNTNWYIKQLKDLEPKVPITFSDEQTDALNHQLNPFEKSFPYELGGARITVMVPGRDKQEAMRVQDKMVLHIVDANRWRKPIYFAVTVSDDNRMGLDPYLRMEGLAYRIMPRVMGPGESFDLDRTVHLLDNVYSFRGLGDGTAPMNETTEKLMSNYAACYIQVALTLRQPLAQLKDEIGNLEKQAADSTRKDRDGIASSLAAKKIDYQEKLGLAVGKMDQCVGIMPWDWRPRMLRQELLMTHGRADEAETRAREALKIDPDNAEYLKMLAQSLMENGNQAEANKIWKQLIALEQNPWPAYVTLAKNMEDAGQYDSAIALMKEFQETHPGDRRAASMIQRLQQLKGPGPEPKKDSAMKPDSLLQLNAG